jgi:ElaB/YqjD/DUF883 family membrane-anchored ribosome-binding protein
MNQAEHTFPIPEKIAHELDKVEDELQHQPLPRKVHDLAKANPWQAVGISALAGMLVGMCLRRCR